MNVCLEILVEQIKNFKENYYGLVGACINMLEFSNYTVMENRLKCKRDIKSLRKINDNLKLLRDEMRNLKDFIDKL